LAASTRRVHPGARCQRLTARSDKGQFGVGLADIQDGDGFLQRSLSSETLPFPKASVER